MFCCSNKEVFKAQTFHPILGNNQSTPLNWTQLLSWTSPFPGPILSEFIPFVPAELLLSYGAAFPCRVPCGECGMCQDECDACRWDAGLPPWYTRRRQLQGNTTTSDQTVTAYGNLNNYNDLGPCADACACYAPCNDCDSCKAVNAGHWPGPLRRQRRRMAAEGAGASDGDSDEAANSHSDTMDVLTKLGKTRVQLPSQQRDERGLCDVCGNNYAFPLILTCIDPSCGVTDWSCEASTIPPFIDIETLNAVLHFTDNVLLPPDVLLALWRNQTKPYVTSPPMAKVVCPGSDQCPYLPAGGGVNSTLLHLGFSGIFDLLRQLQQTQHAGHGGAGVW